MTILNTAIPIGLGDLIYIKAMLDPVKSNFQQIRLMYHRGLIETFRGINTSYNSLLDEFTQLFFSEHPYSIVEEGDGLFRGVMRIATDYGLTLRKPELAHLLCQGAPLNLNEPYIVLTTKVRYLPRNKFNEQAATFWNIINKLSHKYKIVILGEKVVEMNAEYVYHTTEHIYSIYNDIISNVPSDKIIDLTIPALGITNSNLSKIQQDCLIMRDAHCVITFGVGGNFSMATAVANTIGYRVDQHDIFEHIYHVEHPRAMITKNWNRFIQILGQQ